MSWRNFLTPNVDKYLVSKDDDISPKLSQHSQSPISGDINKSKSRLDILQAFKQTDISCVLERNQLSSNLLNTSCDKNDDKYSMDDITYNISNTNITDPLINSANISQHIQAKQIQPTKYENKLAKIKDEMSQLKNELSKFPKKRNINSSVSIKTEGNQKISQKENYKPIQVQRQSLSNLKSNMYERDVRQQQIVGHRNSLQQNKSYQEESLVEYDQLSFSQNKQKQDQDSFITECDIQQIQDSLQDHLQKYNRINGKANTHNVLKEIQLNNKNNALTPGQLAMTSTSQQNTERKNQSNLASEKKLTEKGRLQLKKNQSFQHISFIFLQILTDIQVLIQNQQSNASNQFQMHKQSTEYQEDFNKHLELIQSNLSNEKQLRLQIQSQLMSSNDEIFRLNTQLQGLQTELCEFKKLMSESSHPNFIASNDTNQKQAKQSIFSSKRESLAYCQTEGSSLKDLQSHNQSQQQSHQFSRKQSDQIEVNRNGAQSESQKISEIFLQNFEKQKVQVSHLKSNRNQLLEALENIIKVTNQQKQKNSDSKQIKKLNICVDRVRETKKQFKSQINILRQEFLEIGHIEPLNLTCMKEVAQQIDYCSNQSLKSMDLNKFDIRGSISKVSLTQPTINFNNRLSCQTLQREQNYMNNKVKLENTRNKENIYKSQSPDNFVKRHIDNLSRSHFMRKTLDNNSMNNTQLSQSFISKAQKSQSNLKVSSNENLNFSVTDANSFYQNLNETLNNTKVTILNTNKLNKMLIGGTQSFNGSKRNSTNQIIGLESQSISPQRELRNWDQPLQTNKKDDNQDKLDNKPNITKKYPLLDQYKYQLQERQQQIKLKQNCQNDPSKYCQYTFTELDEDSASKNNFDEKISNNQQLKQYTSPSFKQSPSFNLQSNYQTFQQHDQIDQLQNQYYHH